MFCFFAIVCLIGILCVYLQRNIKIEATNYSMKIIKYGSKLLKDMSYEIKYTDIAKLDIISSPYLSFHVIKLKNCNKSINIPNGLNNDFDNFIKHLDEKFCNKKPNNKNISEINNGQILLIALAVFSLPTLILLIVLNNDVFTSFTIVLYIILLILAICSYVK